MEERSPGFSCRPSRRLPCSLLSSMTRSRRDAEMKDAAELGAGGARVAHWEGSSGASQLVRDFFL